MENVVGTKDTQEAAKAVLAIVGFVIERMKDGAGVDDIVAFYSKFVSDSVFKKKLEDGWKGLDNISAELENTNVQEMTELALAIAPDIIALLANIKK